MKFKGDIIITDPCYIGLEYEEIPPFSAYLIDDTGYGDWSCTTVLDTPESDRILKELWSDYLKTFAKYNDSSLTKDQQSEIYVKSQQIKQQKHKESGVVLGEFCADSGQVAVFLLEEVLKYNPTFNYHSDPKYYHTCTLIKDFDGDVSIEYDELTESNKVIGKGNINFYTRQSGF